MNKLIEAEKGRLALALAKKGTVDLKLIYQSFHLFEKALREDILSKLPAEKGGMKRGSYDCCVNSPECECLGWDSCLSQVKNIIKPKDV